MCGRAVQTAKTGQIAKVRKRNDLVPLKYVGRQMRKKNFPYAEDSWCFQPTDSVLFVLQFKVDLPGVRLQVDLDSEDSEALKPRRVDGNGMR